MKQRNWQHLLFFVLAIPVVIQLAGYLGRSAGKYVNEREAASSPPPTNQEIRVVTSSQDAEGVTQQNLDLDFLKNLEAYTVERTKLKAREFLASQGHPNAQLDITSEATYVESGPIKLAVIRLNGSDGSTQVLIAGVVGEELKRVLCGRNSPETIPVTYGVCGEKIKDVFGTKLGG